MVYLSRPFRYTGQCRDSDAEVPTTGVDLTHTRDAVLFDVRRGPFDTVPETRTWSGDDTDP